MIFLYLNGCQIGLQIRICCVLWMGYIDVTRWVFNICAVTMHCAYVFLVCLNSCLWTVKKNIFLYDFFVCVRILYTYKYSTIHFYMQDITEILLKSGVRHHKPTLTKLNYFVTENVKSLYRCPWLAFHVNTGHIFYVHQTCFVDNLLKLTLFGLKIFAIGIGHEL
jgi:hypothetical protein